MIDVNFKGAREHVCEWCLYANVIFKASYYITKIKGKNILYRARSSLSQWSVENFDARTNMLMSNFIVIFCIDSWIRYNVM